MSHWLQPISRYLLRDNENFKYLDNLLNDPLQWEKICYDEMKHKKTGLVLVCNPYFKFDYFAIKKPQKVELDYIMKSALLGKAFEIFNDTMHAHEQVKLTNLINQLKLTHGDQDQ
ncbi:hypothetical protein ACFGWN_03780 [Pasteurella multocida]